MALLPSNFPPTTSSAPDTSLVQSEEARGLADELSLEANRGKNIPIDPAKLNSSFIGFKASNPGASLADFAKEVAPKLGVTPEAIRKTIQMSWDEQRGLADELTLERNKGQPIDSAKLNSSLIGYQDSHPGATERDFATQESAKLGVSATEISNLIRSESVHDVVRQINGKS